MQWISALSTESDSEAALAACCGQIAGELDRRIPDLVIMFVSSHHSTRYQALAELVQATISPVVLIGCSTSGVIGTGREVEDDAGMVLVAAVLPGVKLTPFHLDQDDLTISEPDELVAKLAIAENERPHFLLFGDPFSFDAENFVRLLDWSYPEARKVGGLASGSAAPGGNVLFLDHEIQRAGLVGVALSGNIEMETLVAQGCRPIGVPMFITACRDNLLISLNDRHPREVVLELFNSLSPQDQALFGSSLFIGLEMKPQEEAYRQGDFLIRHVLGLQAETGYLVVGASLQETGVAQFHLRDADASHADLDLRLKALSSSLADQPGSGALLFSCVGRGTNMYDLPHHDANLFGQRLGQIPLGGFFCNGEIGPVGGQTFLHGYTSCFAVFRPRSDSDDRMQIAAIHKFGLDHDQKQ